MEEKFQRQGFENLTRREDVPMHEVLRLMAREAMTGEAPPESGRAAMALWRPMLEGKIAPDLAKLSKVANDQDAYAAEVRRLLSHLDMSVSEEFEPQADESDDDEVSQAGKDSDTDAEGGEQEQGASAASEAGAEDADQTADPGMEEIAMQPSADEMGEELPTNEVRRSDADSGAANPQRLPHVHDAIRRGGERGGPMRRGGADAPARVAGPAVAGAARRHRAVGEPAAAQAAGAADPLLELRPRGRAAGTRRGWRAWSPTLCCRCPSSRRSRRSFAIRS